MKYYPDMYDAPVFCPACDWQGTGHEADEMDGYDGDTDSYGDLHMVCPKCAADVEACE